MNVPTNPAGSLPQIIVNHEGLFTSNLIEYFQALFFLGENIRHPYHNFRHCTHVLFLCHDGARFHKEELTPRQIRNLLVAAIFHDYNHLGVAGDDARNIERAVQGLRELILPEDEDHLDDIELLLRGTQYPYAIDDTELPLEGLILRDADLMQAFSVAWIQQVVLGLAAEWGKTPIEVLAMQKGFLNSIQFKTGWGRYLVPEEAKALKIAEAEALLNILSIPAHSSTIRSVQGVAA